MPPFMHAAAQQRHPGVCDCQYLQLDGLDTVCGGRRGLGAQLEGWLDRGGHRLGSRDFNTGPPGAAQPLSGSQVIQGAAGEESANR